MLHCIPYCYVGPQASERKGPKISVDNEIIDFTFYSGKAAGAFGRCHDCCSANGFIAHTRCWYALLVMNYFNNMPCLMC